MVTRTFIQQGQGYGSTPVNVTVKLDGNTVYSGVIPTVDQAPPQGGTGEGSGPVTNLFSWTNDTSFSGTQDFRVEVAPGGILLMTQTVANYTETVDNIAGNVVVIPGNVNGFLGFWTEQIGDASIGDPFTNETIDNVPQEEHPDPGQLSGQWWWYVSGGSVFAATLNVPQGNVG